MKSYWQIQPIFGSYWLVIALAGIMLLLLFVGPSFASLSPSRRRWLVWLRGLVALLMLVAMLRPARITTQRRVQTAQLLVLLDASRSMQVKDGEGGRSRWEVQREAITRAIPQLADMGENFEVELLTFASALQPLKKQRGTIVLPPEPEGEETDIGRALSEALQRHVGKRLAGVIMIGDGAQRVLVPDVPPQQAARQLRRRATPLYTVAIGRSRDQSQSRDVAIENMQDQYAVFAKNEFVLRVGVRIQGYVNQPVPVALEVVDEAGAVEIVGPYELRATQDSQVVMAEFSYRPEVAGQYQLRVIAREQVGEVVVDNNQLTAFLNVREGGLRVLLMTSALLHGEQKWLRRSLDQSVDIETDFQPIDVLTQSQWPLDLQADLPLEKYDVFLIGDVDARALRDDNWLRIANLVAEGRGLMMYGGYHSFGPGGYGDSPLVDVLPVKMSRLDRQPLDPQVPVRADMHLMGELAMLPTTDSSIMHLAAGEGNTAAWQSLKPLLGANRFGDLKDQAVVLAKTQHGDPLLVQGGYISGRVLALATDSTHRWYRYGRQDVHKKFWRQAILWLARRDQQQANEVWISLPQRRFRPRTRVAFTTGLNDQAGDLVPDARLEAMLTLPDGTAESIELSADRAGRQGLIANTQQPGIYRLTVRAPDSAAEVASSHADFVVLQRDLELSAPAANPGLLDLLAKMTGPVGGKALAPEQLSSLLEQIKASPPRDEIETQYKWQLGDTGCDAWAFYLVLVGLLGSEWYLRKRWGLV